MAVISGSVTVNGIMWQMIVVLFVAVYLDVTVAGEIGLGTATESPEQITELQTIIIELSEDEVDPSLQPPIKSPRPPSSPGQDCIKIRFTLQEYKWINRSKKLEKEVLDQVSLSLEEDLPDFAGAEFEAFRKSKEDSGLTADVEIYLNEKLSAASRAAAYDILLDLVAEKGAIGSLRVGGLKVENDIGQMNAFTYCNVTTESCPDGAYCIGDGSSCTASCKMNEAYCLNGGTCRDENMYITCICPDGVTGKRCEVGGAILSDAARVAVIAVAVVVFLLILLILLFCFVRKCQPCSKPSRELYGVENVVALHSIRDEAGPVGGVAIQTDDSFLLNLSYANGVPPKAGYSHKIMQTNESFLLARSQNPRVAQVKAQAHLSQSQNGSPTTSENSNGSREPKPSPQGSTPRPQLEDKSKMNAEGTQTGGSLPRKIIKV